MRTRLLAFILFIVFAVSGCAGTAQTSFSDSEGLRINTFSLAKSEMYDFDDFNELFLEVENVGAKDLKDSAHIFIYGPAVRSSRTEGWVISACESYDQGCPFVLQEFLYWELSLTDAPFYAPSEQTGERGSVRDFRIEVQAPDQQEGITAPYKFHARVCYPYETASSSTVSRTTERTFTSEEGKSLAESMSSAGPIHIRLLSLEKARTRGNTLPLRFEITDVGGGFATSVDAGCLPSVDHEDRGVVDFEVFVDNTLLDDCSERIRLFDNKAIFDCEYEIAADSAPEVEVHVSGRAKYRYHISAETSVSVVDSYEEIERDRTPIGEGYVEEPKAPVEEEKEDRYIIKENKYAYGRHENGKYYAQVLVLAVDPEDGDVLRADFKGLAEECSEERTITPDLTRKFRDGIPFSCEMDAGALEDAPSSIGLWLDEKIYECSGDDCVDDTGNMRDDLEFIPKTPEAVKEFVPEIPEAPLANYEIRDGEYAFGRYEADGKFYAQVLVAVSNYQGENRVRVEFEGFPEVCFDERRVNKESFGYPGNIPFSCEVKDGAFGMKPSSISIWAVREGSVDYSEALDSCAGDKCVDNTFVMRPDLDRV